MIKEYVVSVLSASFAAGIFGILLPEKSGVAKYVRYLASLALVLCIILPLREPAARLLSFAADPNTLDGVIDEELKKYTEQTNEQIIGQNSDIICSAIKEELKEKLGIPAHECDVTLELERGEGEVRILKVNVFLSGYSMWKDQKEIKSLVRELVGSDCEVIAG